MNKFAVSVAIGAGAGLFLAPKILDALKIEASSGFGMDDLVTVGVVVAAAMAVRSAL